MTLLAPEPALAVAVVCPAALQVARYALTAAPPLLAGGVKLSVALPALGVAPVVTGAPGTVGVGVTDTLPLEAPQPALLLAAIEHP